jgi:hypothetical protein
VAAYAHLDKSLKHDARYICVKFMDMQIGYQKYETYKCYAIQAPNRINATLSHLITIIYTLSHSLPTSTLPLKAKPPILLLRLNHLPTIRTRCIIRTIRAARRMTQPTLDRHRSRNITRLIALQTHINKSVRV